MTVRHLALVLLFGSCLGEAARSGEPERGPEPADTARIEADVRWLAHPDRNGRAEAADREAVAAYLAARFEAVGLRPVPGRDGWFQDGAAGGGAARLRNVLGWLPPTASGIAPEEPAHLLVLAGYDHLGRTTDGELLPGANGNASGVAALLEVARRLASSEPSADGPRRCGILFAALDLTEQGEQGARRYLAKPPLPLSDCRAVVELDMLGRSFGDLAPGLLMVIGTEHSTALRTLAAAMAPPAEGRLQLLSSTFHLISSNYTLFARQDMACAYLTAGSSSDYHKPGDDVDRIDWVALGRRTAWAEGFLARLAASAEPVDWHAEATVDLPEIRALRELCDVFRAQRGDSLPALAQRLLQRLVDNLDAILARGEVTAAEVTALRTMMEAMMPLAQSMGGR